VRVGREKLAGGAVRAPRQIVAEAGTEAGLARTPGCQSGLHGPRRLSSVEPCFGHTPYEGCRATPPGDVRLVPWTTVLAAVN
jgi:hypothetical protein